MRYLSDAPILIQSRVVCDGLGFPPPTRTRLWRWRAGVWHPSVLLRATPVVSPKSIMAYECSYRKAAQRRTSGLQVILKPPPFYFLVQHQSLSLINSALTSQPYNAAGALCGQPISSQNATKNHLQSRLSYPGLYNRGCSAMLLAQRR
jgi:hypothetical protein